MLLMVRRHDSVIALSYVDAYAKAPASALWSLKHPDVDIPYIRTQIQDSYNMYKDMYLSIQSDWVLSLLIDYPDSGLYQHYSRTVPKWSKILTAACPVDLYIYDSANVLVGSVINNVPAVARSLTIVVMDDVKHIYFYGDENYRIEYIGNDAGSMDVTVTEFDADGNAVRDVYFYDVPLTHGLTYEKEIHHDTMNAAGYNLTGMDGVIAHDADTWLSGM